MEQKWSNQSIRTQILALTALGVAGLLAVMVTAIIQMNHALDAAIAAIAAKVQAEVETAYSILQRYASEEAAGHLTRDQAQQRAKDTLRTMRYDGNNYFFVIDVTPRMV